MATHVRDDSRARRPSITMIEDDYLIERLALDVRHGGLLCRVAYRDQQVWPLVGGAVEDSSEEGHRAGRVGEGCQAGVVRRGQQQADGDAYGFVDVIHLSIIVRAAQLKDHDQPRGDFKKRLVLVGAKCPQVGEPLVVGFARVELALFRLCAQADFAF